MSEPLLAVQSLRVAYGASQVLFDIDAEVRPGEVIGLLGRNGMGKTTLIRSIIGLKSIQSGSVSFEGQQVHGNRPDTIARLGVAVVPEGGLRAFSATGRAQEQHGQPTLRRRAANAGHRPCPGDQPQAAYF